MSHTSWIDRLYDDASLTDNLTDDEAGEILKWAESSIASCSSWEEAERVIGALRRVNRLVGEGGAFQDLFAEISSGNPRKPE